ncbi:hypothetical protein TNCV_1632081 [Trichonephila clavipes]|nr:hypothetical protein TNCV_1632081 [Trichonephila clavipes]
MLTKITKWTVNLTIFTKRNGSQPYGIATIFELNKKVTTVGSEQSIQRILANWRQQPPLLKICDKPIPEVKSLKKNPGYHLRPQYHLEKSH